MTDDSLLAKLAEEFTTEMRAGKPADIEEYARKHPELAARIRGLFPTLMMLEGVAGADDPEPAQFMSGMLIFLINTRSGEKFFLRGWLAASMES